MAGVASGSPWRRVVAVGLLVFVGRGARWSPERSISFAGALGGPLSVAFRSQGSPERSISFAGALGGPLSVAFRSQGS